MKCFDKFNKKIVKIEEEIVVLNSIEDLVLYENSTNFNSTKFVLVSEKSLKIKDFHFLFFIGKSLILKLEDPTLIEEVFLNPTIQYIIIPKSLDLNNIIKFNNTVKTQRDIDNILCHIDFGEIKTYCNIELIDLLKPVWNHFVAYNIYNVDDINYVDIYENIAESIGEIRLCHPVNDSKTKFAKSRDIKPNLDLYHFFSSTTRQPLHTDYAYYNEDEAPDWLMLYCVYPSELGGETQLLSNKTLTNILSKFKPELLSKIHRDITYKYNGIDGDKTHQKQLFDGKFINWNYWQIKKELNSEETMKIREELFEFLEKVIVSGGIYDLSKKWNTGDCVIFNDHLTLHGRSAFLGDRWLKDHAVFAK